MFDYFSVLISVILGLALTHVLRGLAKLIHMRHELHPYWVQVIWTFNIVTYVLAIWFGMFWWKGLEVWTAEWFFFLSAYAIVLFMWAFMLYPAESWGRMDCEEFFFANRKWFFGFQLAVVLMDIPESVRKQTEHLRALPAQYAVLIPAALIITLTGLATPNRRIHGFLSIAWLVVMMGYLFFTSLERIVGHAHFG